VRASEPQCFDQPEARCLRPGASGERSRVRRARPISCRCEEADSATLLAEYFYFTVGLFCKERVSSCKQTHIEMKRAGRGRCERGSEQDAAHNKIAACPGWHGACRGRTLRPLSSASTSTR
jgi:hypothetical protein